MTTRVEAAVCTAQTGPIWKLGGEPCGCTLSAGHLDTEVWHICSCGSHWDDSCNRVGEP